MDGAVGCGEIFWVEPCTTAVGSFDPEAVEGTGVDKRDMLVERADCGRARSTSPVSMST